MQALVGFLSSFSSYFPTMHDADIPTGDKSLKTLKMALLGATFLVGAAGAASAADIYNKGGSYKDAPEAYLPAISWTGFYFGINGGGAFFNDNSFIDNGDTVFDFGRDDTWLAGVHVGYNWEKPGGWLFGD